ncbi:MAG: hypothetical protein ACRD22_16890 [Terriglobia bacterium]
MKILLVLAFLAATAFQPVPAIAAQKSADQNGLIVSGTSKGNVGCMILEKHTPLKKGLLFAGIVYVRTQYIVLQSFNYKPEKQKFTGMGGTDELNHLAAKDKIKLVVVPSHYTQQQLQQARQLCHP